MKIILLGCEMFGRFSLHKAASTSDIASFNDDAQQLLRWTSKRVLPAFTLSVGDLGFDKATRASSSTGSPLSPIPTGPPRRRTNRNTTPSKEPNATSNEPLSMSIREKEAIVVVARAFATALLQASCVIFAEWLAVGCDGGDQIAAAAVTWTKIFCIDEVGAQAQKELLPAFSRLALQLAKNANLSLLKNLLLECRNDSDESDLCLQKVFSLLCLSRDPTMVSMAVMVVVEAGLESIKGTRASWKRPASLDDVSHIGMGSIRSALTAIVSSKQACVVLAGQLVEKLNNHDENVSTDVLAHMIYTLWFVRNNSHPASRENVMEALRRTQIESLDGRDELQSTARELFEIFVE